MSLGHERENSVYILAEFYRKCNMFLKIILQKTAKTSIIRNYTEYIPISPDKNEFLIGFLTYALSFNDDRLLKKYEKKALPKR